MLKRFSIWIVKNLIIILLAAMIFSYATVDFPNLLKNVFGDVFDYASPEAQQEAVRQLAETCSSLEPASGLITMQQLCSNASMMQNMKDNCNQYRILLDQGRIERDPQTEEDCSQFESGEIDRSCRKVRNTQQFDFSRIGALCKDFKSGKINDKEFFYGVIGVSLGNTGQPTRMGLFEKYNSFIAYLNKNRLAYIAILAVLIFLLYLIINNFMLFYATISDIAFGIGMLIMLPYLLILLYAKYVGLDTTSILGSMFGLGNLFDLKAIISVVLLLFLRTYNNLTLTAGTVFLAAGGVGKIYWHLIKRKIAKRETKKTGANDDKEDDETEGLEEKGYTESKLKENSKRNTNKKK